MNNGVVKGQNVVTVKKGRNLLGESLAATPLLPLSYPPDENLINVRVTGGTCKYGRSSPAAWCKRCNHSPEATQW
jgi:hypothetical protein